MGINFSCHLNNKDNNNDNNNNNNNEWDSFFLFDAVWIIPSAFLAE